MSQDPIPNQLVGAGRESIRDSAKAFGHVFTKTYALQDAKLWHFYGSETVSAPGALFFPELVDSIAAMSAKIRHVITRSTIFSSYEISQPLYIR